MQSRSVLLPNRLVGSFKLDVATVWLQAGNNKTDTHTQFIFWKKKTKKKTTRALVICALCLLTHCLTYVTLTYATYILF